MRRRFDSLFYASGIDLNDPLIHGTPFVPWLVPRLGTFLDSAAWNPPRPQDPFLGLVTSQRSLNWLIVAEPPQAGQAHPHPAHPQSEVSKVLPHVLLQLDSVPSVPCLCLTSQEQSMARLHFSVLAFSLRSHLDLEIAFPPPLPPFLPLPIILPSSQSSPLRVASTQTLPPQIPFWRFQLQALL